MQSIFDWFALSKLSTLVALPRILDQSDIHKQRAIQPEMSLHPTSYQALKRGHYQRLLIGLFQFGLCDD